MAPARIPFARYMERCLYDETFGYYGAGRVRFGPGGQFSTYAEALSPLFGGLVARAVREGIVALERSGRVPDDAPLTVLELGAGNGDLARDVLDELARRSGEDGWELVDRLTYVIGDRSAALRERQRVCSPDHTASRRLVVRSIDAADLAWDGPFHGVVLANELVDAFPCEHLILTSRLGGGFETAVRRVMVWGETASGTIDDEGEFWTAVSRGEPLRVRADAVPWTEAWNEGVPHGLEDYLEHVGPLVDDLATCELLPASLCWGPATPRFVGRLAELIDGPERAGVALLVDYGGTSRHVLDPRSRVPHLRAYGQEPVGPLDTPSRVDLTWDVDFTDLARLARSRGLSVLHFGTQACLAGPRSSPREDHRTLTAALRDRGHSASEARAESERLLASFRESRGFHLLALGPEGVAFAGEPFGVSASVGALETMARGVDPAAVEEALGSLGLPGASDWLVPCCDPRANCVDHDLARYAEQAQRVLAERGWLRGPGQV